jgi:hypothetical protein
MRSVVLAVDASSTRARTLAHLFGTVVVVRAESIRASRAGAMCHVMRCVMRCVMPDDGGTVWLLADRDADADAAMAAMAAMVAMTGIHMRRLRPEALTAEAMWQAMSQPEPEPDPEPESAAAPSVRTGLESALGAAAARTLWTRLSDHEDCCVVPAARLHLRLRLRLRLFDCVALRTLCRRPPPLPPPPPPPLPAPAPAPAPRDLPPPPRQRVRTLPPEAYDLVTLQAAACRLGLLPSGAHVARAVRRLFDGGHIRAAAGLPTPAARQRAKAAAAHEWPAACACACAASASSTFTPPAASLACLASLASSPARRRVLLRPVDFRPSGGARVPATLRPVYDLIRRRSLAEVMPSAVHEYAGPLRTATLRVGFLAAGAEGSDVFMDKTVGSGTGTDEATLLERLDVEALCAREADCAGASIARLVDGGFAALSLADGRLHATRLGRALLDVLDTDLAAVAGEGALTRLRVALAGRAGDDAACIIERARLALKGPDTAPAAAGRTRRRRSLAGGRTRGAACTSSWPAGTCS